MNKLEKLKAFLDVLCIGYMDSEDSDSVEDNQIVVRFDGNLFDGRNHFEFFTYDADTDELRATCTIIGFDERPSTLYALANKINMNYNSKAYINDSNNMVIAFQIVGEDPKTCYMFANAFAQVLSEEIEKYL